MNRRDDRSSLSLSLWLALATACDGPPGEPPEDAATGTEESSTTEDGESSSGDGPPICIDPHFVVFLASDGVEHLEVPEDLTVTRSLADGTALAAECVPTGVRGECMIACAHEEIQVETVAVAWPCDEARFATASFAAATFFLEVDAVAAEVMAGCG